MYLCVNGAINFDSFYDFSIRFWNCSDSLIVLFVFHFMSKPNFSMTSVCILNRREIFGVFRVKNHDFTPKNHIFFPILGGGAHRVRPPPLDPPLYTVVCAIFLIKTIIHHFLLKCLYQKNQ